MGWTPQVDSSGKVSYIDTVGDQGGAWNFITKHLPRAIGETFGEAITPSLNPVGGDLNAQDYISQHAGLTNKGGESIPEALLKGAGEGALGLVVPRTSADLQGSALGVASGAALEGATAARSAGNAFQAGRAAREGARTKLKASGSDQYLASRRAAQRGINQMGEAGGPTNPLGKTPYKGPRPTGEDITQFERGTGVDRGIPPQENPKLDAARTSANAYSNRTDPVKGHQLKMAKYRMKKEQLGQGVRKMGEEQVDEGQRRMAERYLYDRARNAPVDVEKTQELAQRGAPKPFEGSGPRAPIAGDPNSPRPLVPANQPGERLPTMGGPADLDQLLQWEAAASQNKDLNRFAGGTPQLGSLIEQLQQAAPNVDFDTWIALLRKAQMDRGY